MEKQKQMQLNSSCGAHDMACFSLAGGYMFSEGIRYFTQTPGRTCATWFKALSTWPQSVRDQLFMKTE